MSDVKLATGGLVGDIKRLEPRFKIGDIVRLKSGGPDMTVIGYETGKPFVTSSTPERVAVSVQMSVAVEWFSDGIRCTDKFAFYCVEAA